MRSEVTKTMEKMFKTGEVRGELLKYIKDIVQKKLGQTVTKVTKIYTNKELKTYRVDVLNNLSLRFDAKFDSVVLELQNIAVKNNIEVPKVIFIDKKHKFSEWIDGVMLARVWNIAEVFVKSGDLIGRLNLVKHPKTGRFLMNSEFSSTNAIWTKDRKVYIVDHDRLKTSTNPDASVVQILLKRIREKERINLFLKSYSKYRSIDNIVRMIESRNWNWDKRKVLMTNASKLVY